MNLALQRLHIFPGAPERKISNVQLTDQQYDDFSATAGQMAKMRLDAVVGQPAFAMMPPGIQTKQITQTIAKARELAETLIKMRNPQLIQQAMVNRRDLMLNGRPAP